MEDLYVKFTINSKHEKFNDLILEGLVIEAAGYLTSVAAMQCRGIDQETVKGYADSYTPIRSRIAWTRSSTGRARGRSSTS